MKEDPVVVVVAPPCCVACKQPIEKVEGKFIGESTDVSKVRGPDGGFVEGAGQIHVECARQYEILTAWSCANCFMPIIKEEGKCGECIFLPEDQEQVRGESKPVHTECANEYMASLAIERMIRDDPDGTWVEKLFEVWPVDGEPTEVVMADGNARKTWPLSWGQLEELLRSTGAVSEEKDLVHFKTKTVNNSLLPNITEECVTWPSIQNQVRHCWEQVNGQWVREEHVEDGAAYRGLLRSNTLSIKKEGLAKMLKDKGRDGAIDEMWEVYTKWPCVQGEEEAVMRYHRKKLLEGIKEDTPKTTWPLPFEADEGIPSISSLMKECGWTEDDIISLKTSLFDLKDETGVHPNCTAEKVCWPDLQQVFRSVVSDEAWNESLNLEWPPLDGRKVMLRLKIPKDQIENTLTGKYRMYCKPDGGEAFSYGLIISDVQYGEESGEDGKLHGTFQGRPVTDGKYEVKDGILVWDPKTTRLDIQYLECWPGQEDLLKARIKSNCKFACESADGFEQKATNETRNLPNDYEDRVGEAAKPGTKKYYLYDEEAAGV